MNKQTFYKVSEDMSMSLLDQLRQEGRLYYVSSSDELVQKAVSSALKQIRKIDGLSNEPYRKVVAEIWEEILDIRRVRERLLFKKGKQQGKVNWYYVSNIVNYLRIRDVYGVSFNKLIETMFGDNKYGKKTESPNYKLTEAEEKLIREILERTRCKD
jgi:hypothetical protein